MYGHTRNMDGRFARLSGQLAEVRRRGDDRRDHEQMLRDPRMASEHQATVRHALSLGAPGCAYCR